MSPWASATDDAWVVIPAFNEASVIAHTIAKVKASFANVVVVDDCSRDDTGAVARRAGAHICRHPVNLGQGAALQTGIEYALGKGAAAIVTFDADGQHRVEDARLMLRTLREGGYDIVLASRFLGSAVGISPLRYALLKLAIQFTRVTSGLHVTDTHNGLRALSRAAAQRLNIRQNRMAHASEILEKIADLKLRWVEVPNTVHYTRYSIAKGQRASGTIDILKDILLRKLQS